MTHAVSAGLCGDVGADADVQRVRTLIFMVSKSVMRDLDRRLDASGAGVSGPQFGVMRLLSQESATITELGSRMMLSPATLVPVVDTLERKGFVQRGVDPKDRRRVPLQLTDAGAEVVTRVAVVNGPDSLAQGLSGLGDEKAQQLQALLIELVNQFTEDDGVLDRAFATNLNDPPRA